MKEQNVMQVDNLPRSIYENEEYAKAIKMLENLYADRMIYSAKNFIWPEENENIEKEFDLFENEFVNRASDNCNFIIKYGLKEPYILPNEEDDNRNNNFNTSHIVNENITAQLYKRFLYNRAPNISLINGLTVMEEGDSSTNSPPIILECIGLTSQFLHGFQTLSQFTNSTSGEGLGKDWYKLRVVKGAEKLFVTVLALAGYDEHANNFGVITVKDDEDEDVEVFAKIDHGWSAAQWFDDPNIMLLNFARMMQIYGYKDKIYLDVFKFKTAIDQVIQITDAEIEQLIMAGSYKLKKLGVNLQKLEFTHWMNDKIHSYSNANSEHKTSTFASWEELEDYYINGFKRQLATLRRLSNEVLSVIQLINMPNYWKEEGKWVYDIHSNDPVIWAISNNITIALDQEQKTKCEAIRWAIRNKRELEGLAPIVWAHYNNIPINNKSAFEYATQGMHKKAINGIEEIIAADNKIALKLRKDCKAADNVEDFIDNMIAFMSKLGVDPQEMYDEDECEIFIECLSKIYNKKDNEEKLEEKIKLLIKFLKNSFECSQYLIFSQECEAAIKIAETLLANKFLDKLTNERAQERNRSRSF